MFHALRAIAFLFLFLSRCTRYLSTHYDSPEDKEPNPARTGYEAIPVIVGMADMYITGLGYLFNKQASYTKSSNLILFLTLCRAQVLQSTST